MNIQMIYLKGTPYHTLIDLKSETDLTITGRGKDGTLRRYLKEYWEVR